MSKFDDMMDYGENRERFNDLKRKLDTIIPFVGAGLSVPFGFPQWGEFLLSCCSHNFSIQDEVKNILNSGKPDCYEEAASYLSKELMKENPNFFHQKIRETFDKDIPSCPESPITLFSSLFKGAIVTTNFDHVIEKNITEYEYKTILISQNKEFSEAIKGERRVVLKLHGDVNDVENIILTKEQYDQSYLKNPEFQKRFDILLMCKTFLFLGCSLNQDRTMEFMKRSESLESTRYVNNYAFMASPAFRFKNIKEKTKEIQSEEILAKQKEKEIEDRLTSVNILPIWYPENEYEWIQEYLNWLQRKNYLEIFPKLLDTPLFLEEKYIQEERLKLEDIYTEPEFAFFDAKKNILKNSSKELKLIDLISQFIKNPLSKDIKEEYKVVNSNYIGNTLFILGEPGIGKSSLVSKIVDIARRKVYCVRLRDLDKKEIKTEGALKAILNILSIEDINLTQKTLILDGVDELCGIENYESSIDDFCFSLIKEASRLNFKLLFTSRLNYVHLEDFRFDTILVLKLLPFQKDQFEQWFDKYYTKHIQTEQTYLIREHLFMLCNTKDEAEKKKLELLGIPLVLYLLVELQVDISEINSLGQLYDKLFDDLKGRCYDEKTTHTLPNLYENCKEIAKYIAQKMFDIQKDILTSEQFHEVSLSLSEELKTSFPMMVENEDFYLLSFYYKTDKSFYHEIDKKKYSVEFIHKSLMEYLVSENLYNIIVYVLNSPDENDQREQLQKRLDEFFTYSAITDEISLFFLEKVKKNKKQQSLFSLLKKYYKFYLEVGFLYKISNNINSFTKIQNLFISYWKLLKILANTKEENLLEEEKDLFCNYLITTPFKNINLSYQNLAETKLRRANLSGADLSGANLNGADLSGAALSGANLSGADLSGAYLSGAALSGANLSEANLNGADLSRAALSWANLSGANLNGADLSRAALSGANLIGANLNGAYLSGAALNKADLSWAYLSGADLSGANLSEAYLSGAALNKADLSNADLSGADLSRTDLSEADLSEAYLNKVDLHRTNLNGTKLPAYLIIK